MQPTIAEIALHFTSKVRCRIHGTQMCCHEKKQKTRTCFRKDESTCSSFNTVSITVQYAFADFAEVQQALNKVAVLSSMLLKAFEAKGIVNRHAAGLSENISLFHYASNHAHPSYA